MQVESEDSIWSNFDSTLSNSNSSTVSLTKTQSKTKTCTGCGNELHEEAHNGYRICESCGTVIENVIDTGAEWRCFNTVNGRDQSMVRCSETRNPLMPDSYQLNTFISSGDKRLQRVHQWNNMTTRERMLQQIYKEFEDLTQEHDLPHVVYKTMCEYYYGVYTAMDERNYGVKRCNIRQGLKAACLFYSCKHHKIPREVKEIARMLDLPRKTITRGCNLFAEIMGDDFLRLPPFKPTDFVERYCATLGVSFQLTKKAQQILEIVETRRLFHESTPPSVAAAAIYRVLQQSNDSSDTKVTFEVMQKKCDVSKTVLTKIVGKMNLVPELGCE